uniref:HMG box domain-containing protein n=1 Tax=Globodera rostochiensis TaxID=31243 RepID=A0A914GXE8_GLORO
MALCQKFGRLLIGAEARFFARTDITNFSTSLDQSLAPAPIFARLPSGYNAPNAFALFTKDQLTGKSGRITEMMKIVSTNWKSLGEDEKQNYSERAIKIGVESRDNFEKLTIRQKKDLWDKHAAKRNRRRRLRMKMNLHKFHAETNRPKRSLVSYMVFMKERFVKHTEPFKTRDERLKFVVDMGQQWRQMTDAEKKPYVDQGQRNIAAYHMKMAEWRQKYANEIRAWKESTAKAAFKAKRQKEMFEWRWKLKEIEEGDSDEVDEKERIQQTLLDDSTHLVEKRERSSDDDKDEDVEKSIQRMFLAISTYLCSKETSQKQRIEY